MVEVKFINDVRPRWVNKMPYCGGKNCPFYEHEAGDTGECNYENGDGVVQSNFFCEPMIQYLELEL